MKRSLSSALLAGIFSAVCLVGCSDETKVSSTEKVSTPEGSTTKKTETTIDSKGSNPPSTSTGETAKTPPK